MEQSFVGKHGDNAVEFFEINSLVSCSLVVDMGAVQHLQEIIISEVLMELLGNNLELLEIDGSILVLIEQSKDPLEPILCFGLTNARGDDAEELFEGDGFVLISKPVDEGKDEGVALVESELLQNLVDFSWIDGSAVVLVEHLEGALELLVILTRESILP